MKYVIYARKSSQGKKRQEASIPAQFDEMREVAKENNLEVVKEFQESKSAKEPGREVFNEMIEFIKEGHADGILCWKLNRLARNPIDEGVIKYLLQNGTIQILKTPNGEHHTKDNVIFTGLEFSQATQYSRDLSEDVIRGNRKKLKRGWWPSKAPFGYKNSHGDKPIILDPERASLLKFAFKKYAQGNTSIKELNKILHNKGLRTEAGKKLTPGALHHKLHNPFYHGLMVRNGETFEGKHEPIITKKLFDKVQTARATKTNSRGYKHFYPYRGFLSCDKCGCRLTADTKKNYIYYYCTNGKGKCDAHKKYMRSEVVDNQIANALEDIIFPDEVIEMMHDTALVERGILKETKKQERERFEKLLKQCTDEQDALFTSYARGKTPKTVYERKIKKLEVEQKQLEKQISKKESQSKGTFEQAKKEFLKANTAKSDFKHGNDIKKQKILKKVLSNATFNDQELSKIQYKQTFQLMANTPKNAEMSVLLGW